MWERISGNGNVSGMMCGRREQGGGESLGGEGGREGVCVEEVRVTDGGRIRRVPVDL